MFARFLRPLLRVHARTYIIRAREYKIYVIFVLGIGALNKRDLIVLCCILCLSRRRANATIQSSCARMYTAEMGFSSLLYIKRNRRISNFRCVCVCIRLNTITKGRKYALYITLWFTEKSAYYASNKYTRILYYALDNETFVA